MDAKLILPQQVTGFMNQFKDAGFEIYLVGGAVRHMLLGQDTHNWDFTTNATPQQIQGLFPENFYNNDYGTVSVQISHSEHSEESYDKEWIFEVTPFRRESQYKDKRHPGKVEWSQSLDEDLARRDFTINAIAYDGKSIVDLFGGRDDLQNKIIRAVGDPDTRFAEDALRLMRAIRFASQLGFEIQDKTLKSIKTNANHISHISWERIRDELLKVLGSEHPGHGIRLFKDTGLLQYILPEVEACFGVEQKSPQRHHIDDVGTHLIKAVDVCPSQDPIVRLATLIHDVGKAPTYKKDEKSGLITFYNHEVVGGDMALEMCDRLRLSKKEKDKVYKLVRYHMFTVSENQTDSAVRRFIRNVGKEYIYDALDLRVADRIGSGAKLTSWRTELFKKRLEEVQKEPFAIKDLEIDGNDVMKTLDLKPGPQVGEILEQLFKDVVEGKVKNNRDELLNKLKAFK